MRPVFTRLFLIFSLALALLLPSSPARADAAVELTSVTLSINGQDYPFRFRPDQVDYDISYTSADPVELTVTAQAAEACKLRIDNVPYEDGHGSATISVSDEHIINLQAYSTRRSQLHDPRSYRASGNSRAKRWSETGRRCGEQRTKLRQRQRSRGRRQ